VFKKLKILGKGASIVSIEERTLEISREIYNEVAGKTPSFFNSKKWKGKIMDWVMKDEVFKVQLFRFVDAIPSIKTEAELLDLFTEYFYGERDLLPKGLKRWIPHKGIPAVIAGKLIKSNVSSLAKQFIAGSSPKDAIGELKKLRKNGHAFTIDLLGEAVLNNPEAETYSRRYLELIDALKDLIAKFDNDPVLDYNSEGSMPKGEISLKVSSFYSRLDPARFADSIEHAKASLKRIIEKAGEENLALTFDMEHYHIKDLTFEIFKGLLDEVPDFEFPGIAVQAYLKDSEDDLRSLISFARKRERKLQVRLVKGAYWDYEKVVNTQAGWPMPVFLNKSETDRNFEKLTRIILENTDVIRPAIASHNIRSIASAIAVSEELCIDKKTLEFQTLYGMAEPIKEAVIKRGYRLRDYVPVGEFLPGMAYLVRRLLENTSNESFLRLSFVEKRSFEDLTRLDTEEKMVIRPKEEFLNTPLIDFADEGRRSLFARNVEKAADKKREIPLIIGGEEVWTDEKILSIDPAEPERTVGIASCASVDDVDKAVGIAKEVFSNKWRRVSVEERSEYLIKAAKWIGEHREEIAATQIFEVGKNSIEADGDVCEAIDFLNFYAKEIKRIGGMEKLGNLPGELNHLHYTPRGVAAVISPWNFPLAIACGMTAAAIVTGNTTILKPSSLSSVTAFYIVKAFRASGLPEGVLQFLPGPGSSVGDALSKHKDVDIIAFTGSMEVGLGLIKRAGEVVPGQANVKKIIAEMGGKNAIIVDGTADRDEAIKGVIASFTGFQGQKCSACSRVILVGGSEEDFLKRLGECVSSMTIGHPSDSANIIGPVIDEGAVNKIKDYIEVGKKEATLYYDCERVPDRGNFVGPVIFKDVKPDARIATEEIFGPVLSVIKAASIDEAIEIANSTPFALTGGIYSRSPVNIKKVREGLSVGNVYINRKITGALVHRQPFGGFKMSGLGSKAGGGDYLKHFTFPRAISENTLRRGFAPKD
jgi:RHH-type proline utilization regulon transcriptional repressor/proline dehydrogenase/delta 1-pyrroline-5-carboxylate dehydrogenase